MSQRVTTCRQCGGQAVFLGHSDRRRVLADLCTKCWKPDPAVPAVVPPPEVRTREYHAREDRRKTRLSPFARLDDDERERALVDGDE